MEVLQIPQELAIDIVRSLRASVEAKKYGSLEQRQAAYDKLRGRFNQLFLDNPQKVGALKSDPDTKRMLFEWDQIGRGSLDEKDGVYKLHAISNQYGQKETIWGNKVKERHTVLVLSPDGAVITEYEQRRITPSAEYSEYPFPTVTESRHREAILDIETALDLASELGSDTFRPTTDSWFANYAE